MAHRRLEWIPWVLIVLMPSVLLWPLPLVAMEQLVAAPYSEAPSHLWGFWAASDAGSTAFLSDRIRYPLGQEIRLIDPLHLIPYVIGAAIGGPALGYNCVLYFGLMVSGLAGLLLARFSGASTEGRILGTCIGLSVPGLLAIGVDGITEGLGAGWVGIQLVALLSLLKRPRKSTLLLMVLSGTCCAWSGAYNAIWMALLDGPILIWALSRKSHRSAAFRGVLGAFLAMLLATPYLRGAASLAGSGPGTAGRTAPALPDPSLPWRGSWREGTDLLDLFVPAIFTPNHAAAPNTAYLGIVLLVASVLGLRRHPELRNWFLGAMAFALLALGPWWLVGGRRLELGAWVLPAPAALFEATPILERISRWYRAGAVAVLLLVPLVVRSVSGRGLLLLSPLIVLDARLGAPLPLSFPTIALPSDERLETIAGPVAELPRLHPIFPPSHPEYRSDRTADFNLLLQIAHGQPTSATLNQMPGDPRVSEALRTLESQLANPRPNPSLMDAARRQLLDAGYESLLLVPDAFRHPLRGTEVGFGTPIDEGNGWELHGLAESDLD